MADITAAPVPFEDTDDLVPVSVACEELGGRDTPLDPSTLYRGIRRGLYPPPIKVGPGMSRWSRIELREAKKSRAAVRHWPVPT